MQCLDYLLRKNIITYVLPVIFCIFISGKTFAATVTITIEDCHKIYTYLKNLYDPSNKKEYPEQLVDHLRKVCINIFDKNLPEKERIKLKEIHHILLSIEVHPDLPATTVIPFQYKDTLWRYIAYKQQNEVIVMINFFLALLQKTEEEGCSKMHQALQLCMHTSNLQRFVTHIKAECMPPQALSSRKQLGFIADPLVQADSACSSTLGRDEPSNAGNAEGVGITSARSIRSTRSRTRGMSNQPGSSGGILPMSRKRKISFVTEEANTVGFEKTENAKVPAQRQNICGVLDIKTDEDMDDATQLCGSSLATKDRRISNNDDTCRPLHDAVKNNDIESFNEILEKDNSQINLQDQYGLTILHHVCNYDAAEHITYGAAEHITALLEKGADVNLQDVNDRTPLHYASIYGTVEHITALLEKGGVDVNLGDMYQLRPIHYAIKRSKTEILTALLNNSYTEPTGFGEGVTPLHYAMRYGTTEHVTVLLESKHYSVNILDDNSLTPLHCAILRGTEEMVTTLLNRVEIDVNLQNEQGLTPLHYAIRWGIKEMVTALLKRVEIDVNLKDKGGLMPLHYAIQWGTEQMVTALLERVEIDVNLKDKGGLTPLHYAILWGTDQMVTALLNGVEIDVNLKNDEGLTPLHYAIRWGTDQMVTALLNGVEIDVNLQDDEDLTPLHYAIKNKKTEYVAALLAKSGIDVNLQGKHGWTPLHSTIRWDAIEQFKTLLAKNDTDVNLQNEKGVTPLHYACRHGTKEQITALLAKDGIKINSQNHRGWTPLHYAAEYGNVEFVKQLLADEHIDPTITTFAEETALMLAGKGVYKACIDLLK